MHTRREFVVRAPAGLLGVVAACRGGDQNLATSAGDASTAGSESAPATAGSAPGSGAVLQWTPQHNELVYTFGGAKPAKHIQSGTRIVTWTEDCFDGLVKGPADLPSKVMPPGHDNPQTGPFYVEGATPGDSLAIHIVNLTPARSWAVSSFSPGFGALVGTTQTAMLGPAYPETTWRYEVDAQHTSVRTTSRDGKHAWAVPVAPFLGCLGVAPPGGEVRSTLYPGPFGGNMDCPQVRAGNTVYLGVNMPGGLVSFGDGHYAMGEGEIMGAAVEGAMNVEVVVDLVKGKYAAIPRIENADEVMFVGSGRPLEDAARVAFKAMVDWVREGYGLSDLDAYQFVSQNTKATIIQIVDPEYTVLVRVQKNQLPTGARA